MTGPDPALRDFPNIYRLLAVAVYAPLVGGDEHVGTETPDDLEDVLPFVRINRMGGPRTELVDYPMVDVSLFTADEAAGWPLASQLANVVMTKPYPHPALDLVDCTIAPRDLPWPNEEIRHWGWSYEIQTRKVRVDLLP